MYFYRQNFVIVAVILLCCKNNLNLPFSTSAYALLSKLFMHPNMARKVVHQVTISHIDVILNKVRLCYKKDYLELFIKLR